MGLPAFDAAELLCGGQLIDEVVEVHEAAAAVGVVAATVGTPGIAAEEVVEAVDWVATAEERAWRVQAGPGPVVPSSSERAEICAEDHRSGVAF